MILQEVGKYQTVEKFYLVLRMFGEFLSCRGTHRSKISQSNNGPWQH